MSKAGVIPGLAGRGSLRDLSRFSHVLFCCNSVDATRLIFRYASSFPDPGRLLVFCVGVVPERDQVCGIAGQVKNKKIIMLLPGDLLGSVAAIKIAVWLKNRDVSITYLPNGSVEVVFDGVYYVFAEHRLTLSAFEKASGFRSRIRNRKMRCDF